jgi:hypothetical protein
LLARELMAAGDEDDVVFAGASQCRSAFLERDVEVR